MLSTLNHHKKYEQHDQSKHTSSLRFAMQHYVAHSSNKNTHNAKPKHNKHRSVSIHTTTNNNTERRYTPNPLSSPISSPILQTRHNNRSILHRRTISPIILHHEVDGQTQFPTPLPTRLTKRARHDLGIVNDTRRVIPSAHEALVLAWLAINVLCENLHHIFFGVGDLVV
jgi:hypothetical protein